MPFKNRCEAGRKLAEKLLKYKWNKDAVILAIPRGGVEVGYEIAKILGIKLDLIVTKKRWSSYSNGFAKENRKVIEICEPETKHEKLGAEQVFGFDFEKNIFRKNSNGKKVCEKIMRAFSLDKNGIEQELGNRMRFLKALGKPKQGEFFDAINNYGKAN